MASKQVELKKKRENHEELLARVEALESKLLTGTMGLATGNTSIQDITKQQQLTLEKHRQEIFEREVRVKCSEMLSSCYTYCTISTRQYREREMRQQLEVQDEEVLDFKENFSSLQQEIEYKTRKLRKMYAKWQNVKQELNDMNDEFRKQREELEEAQEMLLKELRLKQVLIDNFIPRDFKRKTAGRMVYDEEEEVWTLTPSKEAPLLPRNCASVQDFRPTSEFEKLARSADDANYFGRYKVINFTIYDGMCL